MYVLRRIYRTSTLDMTCIKKKHQPDDLFPFARDGSKPDADELGPAASGAEGLLCPVPP